MSGWYVEVSFLVAVLLVAVCTVAATMMSDGSRRADMVRLAWGVGLIYIGSLVLVGYMGWVPIE